MSGSLGELVISIAADVASFKSDMGKIQKSTDDATKQMMGHFDNFGKSITNVTNMFKTLAAVAGIGSMAGFIKESINAADEIGKMAQKVGLSVQELSALKYAGSLADVSMEQLGVGVKQLSKNIVEAESGSKAQTAAFKALSIEIKNNDGNLKSNNQILTEVADRFSKLEDGTAKTAIAMKIFGKSGADMIPLLNSGADGLADMRKEAEKLGVILDEKTTKAAEKFNDDLTRLATSTKGIGFAIANDLLPFLIQATEALNKMVLAEGITGKIQAWSDIGWGDKGPGWAWSTEEDKKQWAARMGKSLAGTEFVGPPVSAKPKPADDTLKKYLGSLNSESKTANAATNELNNYIKAYNQLQDTRKLNNPWLTAENKELLQLQTKYDDLIVLYPQYRAELERNLELDKRQITIKQQITGELEEQKKQIKWFLDNVNDMVAAEMALEDFNKAGLNVLKAPKTKTGKTSLTGIPQLLLGDEIKVMEETNREKLAIEKRYNDEMMRMKLDAAEQTAILVKDAFSENIAVQLGLLAIEKTIAIARILANTEVAASAALIIPIVGEMRAAEIRAMGYISVGVVAASGIIEGMQTISGKRAAGGTIAPYSTYLVGEKGPELLTTGSAGGYVTPNSSINSGSVTILQTFHITGVSADIAQNTKTIAKEAADKAKAEILSSMNRGGTFALASGRMR